MPEARVALRTVRFLWLIQFLSKVPRVLVILSPVSCPKRAFRSPQMILLLSRGRESKIGWISSSGRDGGKYKQMMVMGPTLKASEKRLGIGMGKNVKGVDGEIKAVTPLDPR
jgi:hypothetical protein